MITKHVYTPDLEQLRQLASDGYLTERQHPTLPLSVWNYTAKTQYSGFWTPATRACRGLVTDHEGRVVARPFPKFFNVEEHDSADLEGPWTAYEKLDGTLGIIFWYGGRWHVCTRGSFLSDQAAKATQILHFRYREIMEKGNLDPAFTYLVEIIYPENRIVVDYEGQEMLVLVGMIHTECGWDGPPEYSAWGLSHGFPVASRIAEGDGFDDIYQLDTDKPNAEGYVLNFNESVGRVKLKFETYRKLHRLVTSISTKRIWDMLRNRENPLQDLAGFPLMSEGYQNWVKEQVQSLRTAFNEINDRCSDDWRDLVDHVGEPPLEEDRSHRSLFARHAKNCTYPNALFLLYDGFGYDEYIWKMIKPAKSEIYKTIDLE